MANNTYPNRWRTRGDIALGRWLARSRVQRSLTQADMAQALTEATVTPWTQVRVSNYETSRSPLTVSQLAQVLEVLGMDRPWSVVGDIYQDTTSGSPAWATQAVELTPAGYPVERVVK